jgi:hypothetical protein
MGRLTAALGRFLNVLSSSSSPESSARLRFLELFFLRAGFCSATGRELNGGIISVVS